VFDCGVDNKFIDKKLIENVFSRALNQELGANEEKLCAKKLKLK
jgi:hypothetical protein